MAIVSLVSASFILSLTKSSPLKWALRRNKVLHDIESKSPKTSIFTSILPGLVRYILPLHPSLYWIGSLPLLTQPQDAFVKSQHFSPCPRHLANVDKNLSCFTSYSLSLLFGILFHHPICIHHCPFHYLINTFRVLKRKAFGFQFFSKVIHLLIPVLFIFFPHRPFVELREKQTWPAYSWHQFFIVASFDILRAFCSTANLSAKSAVTVDICF